MMRETRAFRDLPLRVTAFTSRAPGDNKLAPSFGVIVMAEPVDPAVKITAATAGLIDPAGKIVVQLSADEKQLGGPPDRAVLPRDAGHLPAALCGDRRDRQGRARSIRNCRPSSRRPAR